MKTKIAISSGKGGTGKTFVSTNIAKILSEDLKTSYIDCDVEEPNGHLFLKPEQITNEEVKLDFPADIVPAKCTKCGNCVEACQFNAITLIKNKILFFNNLCHVCGACKIACPEDAIVDRKRKIGDLYHGNYEGIDIHYANLETGEGGMSPRLIKKVKKYIGEGINIIDSPPGTSCPVVETVQDADLCVLVTDPTPFGVNDLKLSVDMCRAIGCEPVVLINRAEYRDDKLKKYCKENDLKIIGEIPDKREIAEAYSEGDLVIDKIPSIDESFRKIALDIFNKAKKYNRASIDNNKKETDFEDEDKIREFNQKEAQKNEYSSKELVVISGKGGTGKTSLVASFCSIAQNISISDCDVDAADLHLVLNPQVIEQGNFSGGKIAEINQKNCISCGKCFNVCQFDAIIKSGNTFKVDKMACEGCGACEIVCNSNAVKLNTAVNGKWFNSKTKYGPMSHAKLGRAEENSGKLVSLVRTLNNQKAMEYDLKECIVDGSPGTGCPVIASITGSDYAVVVTEPTVSGIHDLKRVLDVIKFFDIHSGIIVNKYDLHIEKSNEIKRIAKEYTSEVLGELPYDKSITEAQIEEKPVVEYIQNDLTEKIKGVWNRINYKLENQNERE